MGKNEKETKQSKVADKDVDYERLGRMIQNIYETSYMERGKLYRMTFVKGIFAGFGGVIGATLVVGFLVWVLSFFTGYPIIDKIRMLLESGSTL